MDQPARNQITEFKICKFCGIYELMAKLEKVPEYCPQAEADSKVHQFIVKF